MKFSKKYIQSLPKTEIHNHMTSMVSTHTLQQLNRKYSLYSEEHFKKSLNVRGNINSLDAMINFFFFIVSFFKSEEDLVLLIKDVLNYMERHNVVYAEYFFDPTSYTRNGLDLLKMFYILDKEIRKHFHTRKLHIIIGVSRMFGLDNSNNILKQIYTFNSPYFIGIDLGGKEEGNAAENFVSVFVDAKKHHLHVVAHAGEEVGPESIWNTIKYLDVERIGHATSAFQDEKLLAYLKKKQIPLEICPTSSIITRKYVTDIKKHPLIEYFQMGLLVTINADDPYIFDTNISNELYILQKKMGFSSSSIIQIIRNGIHSTFLSDLEKEQLQDQLTKELVHQ